MNDAPRPRSTQKILLMAAVLVALAGIGYAITGGSSGALDADGNSTTSPESPNNEGRGDCELGSVQLKSDPTRCVPEDPKK